MKTPSVVIILLAHTYTHLVCFVCTGSWKIHTVKCCTVLYVLWILPAFVEGATYDEFIYSLLHFWWGIFNICVSILCFSSYGMYSSLKDSSLYW